MNGLLRDFCVLAVICGAAMRLAPEGGVRRVMQILTAAALLTLLMKAAGSPDMGSLRYETAKQRERELRFQQSAADARERIDRLVIEEELSTYIQNKAGEMGIRISSVESTLRWETEGFWVPASATLHGEGDEQTAEALLGVLGAELGIPRADLRWIRDE